MYGYGYRYSAKPNTGSLAGYSPLDEASVQFYFSYADATASSWADKTGNRTVTQGTGTKQPTISSLSVDFDGTDDELSETVAQVYGSDSSGILFFSGYYDSSAVNYIMGTCDTASANDIFALFLDATTGVVALQAKVSGVNNAIRTTNGVSNGAYYYGYVKSTGTAYEMNLNGSVEVIASGTDNGDFFADVLNRDTFTLGSRDQLTTNYGKAKINKLAFFNDHTMDTTNSLNFFADANND